jgi:hypothetical protein
MGKRLPRKMPASQQAYKKNLQLPHHFAATAALQEQQQNNSGRNPDHNLHGCTIHDFVSFLLK